MDNNFIQEDWKNIIDPKLRDKAKKRAWYDANKDKKKAADKARYEANKEKIQAINKAYRELNKEKLRSQKKDYRETNRDKIANQKKDYYQKNKEKIKISKKSSYQNNKEKIQAGQKKWRDANKNKIKAYFKDNRDILNEYHRNRNRTNMQYKLTKTLRSRLHQAIKEDQKTGSAIHDLGCTIDELKIYLESKFQEGMSWDNWSYEGWHIDHIKPLASFDLTDRNQLLQACHYTNLQPLWAKDNIAKSDKII